MKGKIFLIILLLAGFLIYWNNKDKVTMDSLLALLPGQSSRQTQQQTTDTPAVPDSDEKPAGSSTDSGEDTDMDDKAFFTYEELSAETTDRIAGISWQENDQISLDDLRHVKIKHYDFNGEIQDGELICNRLIADYVIDIFYELYKAEYPIEQVALIEAYDGDDEASMAANNSSCFNYRTIAGSDTLSLHAYGMAIDINPLYNPYITTSSAGETVVQPASAGVYTDREQDFDGKIDTSDLCYQLFTAYGFTWGGSWESRKDYQHFEKDLRDLLNAE